MRLVIENMLMGMKNYFSALNNKVNLHVDSSLNILRTIESTCSIIWKIMATKDDGGQLAMITRSEQ